jgi:hypothetical protein
MLKQQQFVKPKLNKPKGPTKPRKPGIPGKSSSSGSGSYKFLPVPKSQEERHLMEARARAINAKAQKAQSCG